MRQNLKSIKPYEELCTLPKETVLAEFKKLSRNYTIRKCKFKEIKTKLSIKTRALWFAAGILCDNKIIPNKTQEDIYEMLKAIGKDIYDKDQCSSK